MKEGRLDGGAGVSVISKQFCFRLFLICQVNLLAFSQPSDNFKCSYFYVTKSAGRNTETQFQSSNSIPIFTPLFPFSCSDSLSNSSIIWAFICFSSLLQIVVVLETSTIPIISACVSHRCFRLYFCWKRLAFFYYLSFRLFLVSASGCLRYPWYAPCWVVPASL